jgi:hypothetical protein
MEVLQHVSAEDLASLELCNLASRSACKCAGNLTVTMQVHQEFSCCHVVKGVMRQQ